MSGRRLVLIGLLAFAISLVAFAPASLLKPGLERMPGLAVTDLTGSLWRGSGRTLYRGVDLGTIRFTFAPGELLHARIGYQLATQGPQLAVDGRATASADGYTFTGAGTADLALAREFLARYELRVPGTLEFSRLVLSGKYSDRLPNASGEVRWEGGEIGYRMGGVDRSAVLPPLTGFVESAQGRPQMTIYAKDDSTPILLTHVDADGMASVGITKQFTKLVGQTWIGNEPDHAVVLEVAEKVF